MKKRKKPSARRRASIGIALCFVAAGGIAGNYTPTKYWEIREPDEKETQGEHNKKKEKEKKG